MPTADRPAVALRPGVVVRVVGAVVAAVVVSVLAAQLLRPADDGTPEGFERGFVGACTRSGGGTDACRCAFDRWVAAVPEAERAALDDDLAESGALPATVATALAGC